MSLHQRLFTYTQTPPPRVFPDSSVRSPRIKLKPSRLKAESGSFPGCSHVSVRHIRADSRYAKFHLASAANSSVLLRMLRAFPVTIMGRGVLGPLLLHLARIPPLLPRLWVRFLMSSGSYWRVGRSYGPFDS